MKTIDEEEFRCICEQIQKLEGAAVLQQVRDPAERTQLLLSAAFKRVCLHLGLDFEAQQAELQDADGFALFQTLEEHMEPEFFYSGILDRFLLKGA
jgi:hypothetical protein